MYRCWQGLSRKEHFAHQLSNFSDRKAMNVWEKLYYPVRDCYILQNIETTQEVLQKGFVFFPEMVTDMKIKSVLWSSITQSNQQPS